MFHRLKKGSALVKYNRIPAYPYPIFGRLPRAQRTFQNKSIVHFVRHLVLESAGGIKSLAKETIVI